LAAAAAAAASIWGGAVMGWDSLILPSDAIGRSWDLGEAGICGFGTGGGFPVLVFGGLGLDSRAFI
jgi:hypothetical protein